MDKLLWFKIWRVSQRVLAAAVIWLLHRGLEYVLSISFRRIPLVEFYANVVASVVFFVIYSLLLFDSMLVFVPTMKAWTVSFKSAGREWGVTFDYGRDAKATLHKS